MPNTDFFADPEDKGEAQKFTIGDKQYTQDELNDLVKYGELAKETEAKFSTKLDRIVPDYTRASQEAAELRKKLDSIEKQDLERRAANDKLSPEEQRRLALQEVENLGIWTDNAGRRAIREELEGFQLRQEVGGLVEELSDMGITTDEEAILKYMNDNEISRPERAARELFDDQITKWETSEMDKTKPDDLYTQRGSDTGLPRTPEPIRVTDDNLADLVAGLVNGEE